ncbi:hypothetical protein TrVGV298_010080 [Trichoderma virens]|nr:hypothetical protein TrVGV298_010080 [Trichoderma virens]
MAKFVTDSVAGLMVKFAARSPAGLRVLKQVPASVLSHRGATIKPTSIKTILMWYMTSPSNILWERSQFMRQLSSRLLLESGLNSLSLSSRRHNQTSQQEDSPESIPGLALQSPPAAVEIPLATSTSMMLIELVW